MLETIRAYGRERLAEAGEADRVRAAHAAYFLDLADQARDRLISADQLAWLQRLSEDQDNLHAAVRGAVAAGDAATAVGLAGSLGWYWWLRGLKAEGTELISEALGTPGAGGGRAAGSGLHHGRAAGPRPAGKLPRHWPGSRRRPG